MKFENLRVDELDNNPDTVLNFKSLRSNGKYRFFYLLLQHDYLVLASKGIFPSINGKPERVTGGTDIEIPKSGLQWFINAIEQKFMRTEAEGGLKREELTFSEVIDGEKLVTSRWFGTSGYALANASRNLHSNFGGEGQQEFCFTDKMLFDEGLLDNLKVIAQKIDRGEL
ncbi:hypothetical protein [Agarivorans sp. DSG3-1]|uniref:hypothetical protein n=1 Tax=Agarivorans sp. DSG3-1 TaxID=3342249 RepID=UPI00398F7ECC